MNWLENIELEELETMFTEENEDQLKERFKNKRTVQYHGFILSQLGITQAIRIREKPCRRI